MADEKVNQAIESAGTTNRTIVSQRPRTAGRCSRNSLLRHDASAPSNDDYTA
jgi:hypothetical protein